MKKKRFFALLLTASLALQCSTALAAAPTAVSALSSRITISSNSAQTAEALSLNVQKAYTFTDSDSERYYKFTPSTTDYYEVKVENAVYGDSYVFVYDSTGSQLLGSGEYSNPFSTSFTSNGLKMTAGQYYLIRVCVYLDSGETRPVYTTVVKHTHTTDDLQYTQEASCIEAGYKEYYCSKCMDRYQVVIPKKDHSWKTTYTVDKAATCTQAGQKSIHCSDCNAVQSGSAVSIPALGHDYKKSRVVLATPKNNGKTQYYCSRCNAGKTETIYRPQKLTLSHTSYVHKHGIARKPTVTVKDAAGKTIPAIHYKVYYASGRENVGKYRVTVVFKDTVSKYRGTMNAYFTIKPSATTLKSVTASSKGFTAKWSKLTTQTTGYQIQYSTSSKFTNAKTVLIKNNKTTSQKVSKLSAKKKYYVRVRTYKTANARKFYSDWSKVKTVTTKK